VMMMIVLPPPRSIFVGGANCESFLALRPVFCRVGRNARERIIQASSCAAWDHLRSRLTYYRASRREYLLN